ncbi:hypothetical protein EBR43_05975 [bacterium]|nr:hypothetical protein [bacterium]NBW57321.1 hypothetical protein [bacterium]NBX72161.1 hypothetical protein [bacterium]
MPYSTYIIGQNTEDFAAEMNATKDKASFWSGRFKDIDRRLLYLEDKMGNIFNAALGTESQWDAIVEDLGDIPQQEDQKAAYMRKLFDTVKLMIAGSEGAQEASTMKFFNKKISEFKSHYCPDFSEVLSKSSLILSIDPQPIKEREDANVRSLNDLVKLSLTLREEKMSYLERCAYLKHAIETAEDDSLASFKESSLKAACYIERISQIAAYLNITASADPSMTKKRCLISSYLSEDKMVEQGYLGLAIDQARGLMNTKASILLLSSRHPEMLDFETLHLFTSINNGPKTIGILNHQYQEIVSINGPDQSLQTASNNKMAECATKRFANKEDFYQYISDFFTAQSANGLAPLMIRNALFYLEMLPGHTDKSQFTQQACVSAIHTTAPKELTSSLINTNSTVIARLNQKSRIKEFIQMMFHHVHKVRVSPILEEMRQHLQRLLKHNDDSTHSAP